MESTVKEKYIPTKVEQQIIENCISNLNLIHTNNLLVLSSVGLDKLSQEGWDQLFIEIQKVKGTITTVNLTGNNLTHLPKWLSKLPDLKELNLSKNSLTQLPEWFSKLTHLKKLGLTSNRLTQLPEGLSKLTNLEVVTLSNNKLIQLPEGLSKLTHLNRLELRNNNLTHVPEVLSKLLNLEVLDLSQNSLTHLPEWLSKLTYLNRLELTENKFSQVPEGFGELVNLKRLYLSNNNLTQLPRVLSKLTKLETFDLRDNKLTYLPEWLGRKLSNSEDNLVDSNPLKVFPVTFLEDRDISNELRTRYRSVFTEITTHKDVFSQLEKDFKKIIEENIDAFPTLAPPLEFPQNLYDNYMFMLQCEHMLSFKDKIREALVTKESDRNDVIPSLMKREVNGKVVRHSFKGMDKSLISIPHWLKVMVCATDDPEYKCQTKQEEAIFAEVKSIVNFYKQERVIENTKNQVLKNSKQTGPVEMKLHAKPLEQQRERVSLKNLPSSWGKKEEGNRLRVVSSDRGSF